jgi:hypothetical protein
MTNVSSATLSSGYGYEWAGTAYQEAAASGQTGAILGLAILFAFLFLVGLYESWIIPLPVLLSVPIGARPLRQDVGRLTFLSRSGVAGGLDMLHAGGRYVVSKPLCEDLLPNTHQCHRRLSRRRPTNGPARPHDT